MRTKCIIFGEALKIRGKKFKQNLPEIYSKSTKTASTACTFSNVFRRTCPQTSLVTFLLLNQLQICSVKKNNTLERNVEIMASALKFLAWPAIMFRLIRFLVWIKLLKVALWFHLFQHRLAFAWWHHTKNHGAATQSAATEFSSQHRR